MLDIKALKHIAGHRGQITKFLFHLTTEFSSRRFFFVHVINSKRMSNFKVLSLEQGLLWGRYCPTPRPLASDLRTPQHLTTTTNNGGGQHACARRVADIEPIRVTRAKYYAPLPRSPCTRHCCLLLVMFGFSSTVCLYTERKLSAHALCLLVRFW